jgi:hypothetical protein
MKLKKNIYFIFFVFIVFFFYLGQSNAQISPGYKYPESSDRYLTGEDMKGKSVIELKIMRNEIFAIYGYKFKTKDMREYFSKQKWYKPGYDDVTSKLTRIEIANIKKIKQYENSMQKKNSSTKISELIKNQNREVVFKASWGSGSTQLGCFLGQEADSMGPMSFAVDHSGKLFILDQVNKRIQVYSDSGKYIKAIPLPNSFYSDIDIGQSGNLFLLDAHIDKSVSLIDDKGKELKKAALIGMGITETGGIIGIYSRKDGLWVNNSGVLIRICDPFGVQKKNRLMLKGVPDSNGVYLLEARKLGDITVVVIQRMVGKSSIKNYHIYFEIPVLYITIIDTDKNGNIYLGANLLNESIHKTPPYSIEDSHEVIVVIDSTGDEKQRIYMPVSTVGLSVNRSIRVTWEGIIYQLVLEDKEAVMWRYKH